MKTAAIFQDIDEDTLLSLLDYMDFKIIQKKAGGEMKPLQKGTFQILLRAYPEIANTKTRFKYDMPDFGACGFLMAEIPELSRFLDGFKNRPKRSFKHKPPQYDMDVMVVETDKLMTTIENCSLEKARNTLLRNLLGMLAQKVCDVRHELFLLRDGYDMYAEADPSKCLNVFTAGVAVGIVDGLAEKWNALHPEMPALVRAGGSVDLIRAVLKDEPCDVLVSADDGIIRDMLMPEKASGYTVFAGNEMVVAAAGEKPISSGDWKETLLKDDAVFMHMNPYGDPGGYRAVMSILLADNVEKGLSDKLMSHKGHIGMDKNLPRENMPDYDFIFTYRSGAEYRKKQYARLPDVMNLSKDALRGLYATAEFAVDEANTVKGAPISHAVTVPVNAPHPEAAREFVDMFLALDFKKYGFIEKRGEEGKY